MKGGLVDDRARDGGGAVNLVAEAQSVKPSGPSGVEVSLGADFVPSGLAITTSRSWPSFRFPCWLISANAPALVGLDPK